ncbi:MAG: helix-turn-helix domain-containing protein [Acidobacteriota bacterium]|nr:helix-turn-helix domain-containing protein [Acidobacteriota bacterium]
MPPLSPEIHAARKKAFGARDDPAAEPEGVSPADQLMVHLDQPLPDAIDGLERVMIQRGLRQVGGRVNAAAELLGLSRKGLFLKRRRLGIDPDTTTHTAVTPEPPDEVGRSSSPP